VRSFNRGLDSSIWYYTAVCTPVLLFLVLLVLNREVIANSYFASRSLTTAVLSLCIIISAVIHWLISVAGMLGCNDPKRRSLKDQRRFEISGWDADKTLVVSFVSQGFHLDILKNSVSRAHSVLSSLGVTFQIEVVVDSVSLSDDPWFESYGCLVVEVPRPFVTSSGAKFKARALCYAAEVRKTRFTDKAHVWILHCDEDTLLTPQAVYGIHSFLLNDNASNRCGAGAKKYELCGYSRKAKFFGAVDLHCAGEDLGRYRLQFQLWQASIFGAHGSFLLLPLQLDNASLYEVGERGSLTEDVYVALALRLNRIPIDLISGYVIEQSAYDMKNFLQQRARWIHGLLNALLDARFPIIFRLVWFSYLSVWRISIVASVVLILFSMCLEDPAWILALWGFPITTMATVVVVGALHGIRDDSTVTALQGIIRLVCIFFFVPVACIMETLSVIYAVVYKPKVFHVVEKKVSPVVLSDDNVSAQVL
jgi:hypothetical protein